MFSGIRKTTMTATATLVAIVLLLAGGVTAAVAAADITLTGRVYVDSVPATAGAATLTVERWDGAAWQSYPGSAVTGSDGSYSISGVDAGSYRVRATSSDSVRYPDAFSNLRAVSGSGSSWNMSDIYLIRTYPVSGHVDLGATGTSAGAGEVDIIFTHPLCCQSTTVTTDADGDFAFRLPRGTYSVRYLADDPAYMFYDTTLVITTGVDPAPLADVTLALWPTVSGHVENVAGAGLAGINVDLYGYTAAGAYVGTFSTTTDSGGDYEVTVSTVPADYEVYFSDPSEGYATVAWDDVNPYYASDLIAAGSGPVEGVDAVLPLGGVIRGTVSGSGLSASSFPYVFLEVYVYDYEYEEWVPTGDVYHPDSAGAYRIPALYPDGYRLAVEYDSPNGYVGMLSGVLSVAAGGTRIYNPVLSAVQPPAGQLVKFPDSATVYVTDGVGGLIVLPSFGIASDFGIPTTVRTVEYGSIAITSVYGPLTPVVTCGSPFTIGYVRVGAGGAAVQVSDSDVYGLPRTALPASLCAALPQASGLLALPLFVKTANDPTVWVIDSAQRDRVPDQAVLTALNKMPTGFPNPVRTVSASFMAAIPVGGVARPDGRLVKTSDSPTVYVADDERLVPLASFGPILDGGVPAGILTYAPGSFAGIEVATTPLTNVLRCNGMVYVAGSGGWILMTEDAVDGLPATELAGVTCMYWNRTYGTPAPALFVKSASSPTIYYVDGTTKHPVLSMTTIQRMSAPAPATYLTVNDAFVASLTTGTALLDPAMLVKGSGSTIYLVDGAGTGLVPIPSFSVLTDAGLPTGFATVADAALADIPVAAPMTNVITCLGGTWLAASGKLWPVASAAVTGLAATPLADTTCQQFPRSTASAATQVFVKGSGATIYGLIGGVKRAALSFSTLQRLATPGFPLYLTVADGFLAGVPTGAPLLDPGMLIKGSGPTIYLVDGSEPTLRPVPSGALLADYGVPLSFATVPDSMVSGHTIEAPLTNVVSCLSATWVAAAGTLWPVQSDVLTGLAVTSLADSTCQQLRRSSATAVPRLFLRQSNGTIFSLEGGQKLPVLSMATVQRLAPAGIPLYIGVSDSFLASVPTGSALLDAGMLVKGSTSTIYLIDGLGGKVPVPSFEAVADFGLSTAFVTVSDPTLAGLTTRPSLSNFVDCGGQARIAGAGRLWVMSTADRGSATPTALLPSLCSVLPAGSFSLTTALLVKAPNAPTVFRIVGGQKTAIDGSTFASLGGRYITTNPAFLAGVPAA